MDSARAREEKPDTVRERSALKGSGHPALLLNGRASTGLGRTACCCRTPASDTPSQYDSSGNRRRWQTDIAAVGRLDACTLLKRDDGADQVAEGSELSARSSISCAAVQITLFRPHTPFNLAFACGDAYLSQMYWHALVYPNFDLLCYYTHAAAPMLTLNLTHALASSWARSGKKQLFSVDGRTASIG